MENKIEIKRDLAHVDYESGRYQTMKEHSENVANYAAETCSFSELKILVSLIGVFHDVGKLGRENQEDFERILQYGDDTHKPALDLTTHPNEKFTPASTTCVLTHIIFFDCSFKICFIDFNVSNLCCGHILLLK